MPKTYDITPGPNGVSFLEADLIAYLVANVLKPGALPNFTAGDVSPQPAGTIPLLPGILQDSPDDCGYVVAQEREPLGTAPVNNADVTVTFRALADASGSPTAQEKAHAMASALRNFLHGSGYNLTNVALPSGRYVLAFTKPTHLPLGQDQKNRFRTAVSFTMILRGDDAL